MTGERKGRIRRPTFRVCERALNTVRGGLVKSQDASIATTCLRQDAEQHQGIKIRERPPILKVAIRKSPSASDRPPEIIVLHKKRGQQSRRTGSGY